MDEQKIKPPRLHLVSCLYVITGLLLIYLFSLRFFLTRTITYRVANESIAVTPFVHTHYLAGLLVAALGLAVSYWERYRFITTLAGLIGILVTFAVSTIFIIEPAWGLANATKSYGWVFYENAFAARAKTDASYYPCKYCAAFLTCIMLLRLFDYRPTSFRLTLLDLMLITIAAAIILGTRGMALKAYGLS